MSSPVVVLVSSGRNPITGRPRRSACDASAVELALRLRGEPPLALHVGDPHDPALAGYIGMGLRRLHVLGSDPNHDPCPPLLEELRRLSPALILCGAAGEPDGLGLLPYRLAAGLALPIIPAAAEISWEGATVTAIQPLPGGSRRRVAAPTPAVVTVGPEGPRPRQAAYGKVRRAEIVCLDPLAPTAPFERDWTEAPARPLKKAIRAVDPRLSPEERLKAIMGASDQVGQLLESSDPRAAATALLEFLRREGVIEKEAN